MPLVYSRADMVFADARQSVAQPDVTCLSASVAEFGEAAVLPGHDELRRPQGRLVGDHSSFT
jgi:hypothetical protein